MAEGNIAGEYKEAIIFSKLWRLADIREDW